MKRLLPISILALLVLSFSACTKSVLAPGQYTNPVTGSWVLTESAQNSGYGWRYFNSGLEKGVFDFYSNGTARYDDGYNLMQGSWSSRIIVGGYYDQYGNYYNDSHQAFELHVYDNYTKGSIDLLFDDIVVYGNSIIATNYNGSYISRYIFKRY